MRKILAFAFILALQHLTLAQQASPDDAAIGEMGSYSVLKRSANSRTWEVVTSQTNKAGTITSVTNQAGTVLRFTNQADRIFTRTNRAYTEVAANLSYQDANGNWMDSSGDLDIVADGAASSNSPIAVHFAGDASTESGTVSLTSPDGKVFVSKVFGISYYDPSVPTNILIASLQSAQGSLVGNNHILYKNAFNGLNADLWYTYSVSGVSQDIVIHDSPPDPAALGLNPQTVMLQVFTEWFDPPEPKVISAEDDGIVHDAYLDFGNMFMGPGAALFTQGQADPSPVKSGSIYKHWGLIGGHHMLVEEVRYPVIFDLLQTLPLHASAGEPIRGSTYERLAQSPPLREKSGLGSKQKPVLVAKSTAPPTGLILDYDLVSSVSNYTFQNDTTYYLSTNVTMSGTNTTFEGGTVLKYASNVTMTVNSTVTWQGASYRPVIMTSKNDNSMGGTISGSTGSPGTTAFEGTALNFNGSAAGTNLVLSHLRVLNAKTAVAINAPTNNVVNVLMDVQMVNCANGLGATNATFSLWNGLMVNVLTNFTGTNSTGDVEQLTSDTASSLNTAETLNLTNCLLVAVTNTGSFTSNSVYTASSGSGIFQTVGSGAHYLATNSVYQNAGTTNISPTLAAALTHLTTYPPVLRTSAFSANTTLSPQAQLNTEFPDIGWHYDPLDYVWTNVGVNSGVTLNLTNGVAIGMLNAGGVTVYGSLTGLGTPLVLNQLASCSVVQEKPVNNLSTLIADGGSMVVNLRFTDMPTLGGATTFLSESDYNGGNGEIIQSGPVTLRDCQLNGGALLLDLGNDTTNNYYDYDRLFTSFTINMTNNLFDRCNVEFSMEGSDAANFYIYSDNNLFHAGTLALLFVIAPTDFDCYGGYPAVSWYFYNNLIEGYNFSESGGGGANGPWGYTYTDWGSLVPFQANGYYNDSPAVGETGPVIDILDYQTGSLGKYYYNTNVIYENTSYLLNQGNTSATNVGLYHYTVTTNNVIDGTNTVSIGFHYVAVGTNGLPLDSNGDGIPDYLQDALGNGVYNSSADKYGNWLPYAADTANKIGMTIYTPLQ